MRVYAKRDDDEAPFVKGHGNQTLLLRALTKFGWSVKGENGCFCLIRIPIVIKYHRDIHGYENLIREL